MNRWWLLLPSLLVVAVAHAADDMKAFPPPDAGMTRFVLPLPKRADEALLKVELVVGKTAETDGGNRHFFGGRIETETIPGWGFPRHVVRELGPLAGTLMAVDPNAPRVTKFVPIGGDPYLVRYNSRLPVVVYVPDGVEVRYRLWRGDADMRAMKKG